LGTKKETSKVFFFVYFSEVGGRAAWCLPRQVGNSPAVVRGLVNRPDGRTPGEEGGSWERGSPRKSYVRDRAASLGTAVSRNGRFASREEWGGVAIARGGIKVGKNAAAGEGKTNHWTASSFEQLGFTSGEATRTEKTAFMVKGVRGGVGRSGRELTSHRDGSTLKTALTRNRGAHASTTNGASLLSAGKLKKKKEKKKERGARIKEVQERRKSFWRKTGARSRVSSVLRFGWRVPRR